MGEMESYAPLNPLYERGKKGAGILLGPDLHLYNSIRSGVDGNAVSWERMSYTAVSTSMVRSSSPKMRHNCHS
ncbi:hypothetical protein JCM25156A_24200 [Komagataeibacter kakiaceti JCM 25156]